MAKKKQRKFEASVVKGMHKSAAWLCVTQLFEYDDELDIYVVIEEMTSAWKTASAAKKCVKEEVQRVTPRKSVKMVPGTEVDEKGKPYTFIGVLEFKA